MPGSKGFMSSVSAPLHESRTVTHSTNIRFITFDFIFTIEGDVIVFLKKKLIKELAVQVSDTTMLKGDGMPVRKK
jgi:hypothetical protein